MKVTKTNVFRLEIERDCGCKATREYEDARYQKGNGEGTTTLCDKHASKSEDAQEILREMILDNLGMQAELAGKQYAPLRQDIEEGDTGGVTAQGETVQRMGVNMPKRPDQTTANKPRRDPSTITQLSVDRADSRFPRTAAAAAPGGNLNLAAVDDSDITMDGSIETVPEDPRLSGLIAGELEGEIEAALDEKDMELNGVPRSALNQAKD
jgi:hypothetical protein